MSKLLKKTLNILHI